MGSVSKRFQKVIFISAGIKPELGTLLNVIGLRLNRPFEAFCVLRSSCAVQLYFHSLSYLNNPM